MTLFQIGAAPDAPYRHVRIGMNSRLDALQAALLRVKMPAVRPAAAARARIAAAYRAALADGPGLVLPADCPGHVWHQFTLRSERRDALRCALRADGIDSRIYYPVPLHRQEAYARFARGALAQAEQWCASCLSLPIHARLGAEQVARICAQLRHGLS